MENDYNLLIKKLDEFIRKYYKNKLLRGLIYAISLIAVVFLLLNVLEYYGWFNSQTRAILFFSFISVSTIIIIKFFIIPLLKLYRIGKIISYEQASEIIGTHFSNVKDKLLNILQLKNLEKSSDDVSIQLIEAGINQKISEIKLVPFLKAIDLKSNLKFLKYIYLPLFIIIVILLFKPDIITNASERIVNYNTFYEKPAPFSFNIKNSSMETLQFSDFQLNVEVNGNEIPSQIYVINDGVKFLMEKVNTVTFKYTFKNIQKNTVFQLFAADILSKPYTINVIPKPIITNFIIELIYPKYIGKNNEIIENNGDLVVPYGTKIIWNFVTRETSELTFLLEDKNIILNKNKNELFTISQFAFKSFNYSIKPKNSKFLNSDSVLYNVNVVPDAYPSISIQEAKDTLNDFVSYFKGDIKDDYGFSKLNFHYKLINKEDTSIKTEKEINIPININTNQQDFYYFFDISSLNISPGDEITYYFEVFDNDAINGPKSAKSQQMYYKAPTIKEIEKQTEENNKQIKSQIEKTILEANKLIKQVKDLNRKLIDKKTLSWEEKKQIKDLLDKQNEIKESVEQIKLQNKENTIKEQQFKKIDEEILKKQEELEKLFENIMNDEMKKMFEELQKLMENIDKNKVGEMLEKIKMNTEDISKQLDRNLELFKQLEFEKKLTESIEKLDKLAKEQQKLAEETAEGKKKTEELIKKQNELNQEFEEIKNKFNELEQKNKELENPNQFKRDINKENSISQEQKNSTDALKDGKSGKASKSQNNAAKQMQELADKMQEMQMENEMEQMGEDVETIRAILKNLIKISFKQEALLNKTQATSVRDPKYQEVINEQSQIKDDLKMVEDSLIALSKRQIRVQPVINKEISDINNNLEKTLNDLLAMNTIAYINTLQNQNAVSRQQYIMTAVNNLALLLNESMENMKKEMNSMKKKSGKGNSSCSKPGSGKNSQKSMKSMRQLQEELNKQIEQLKKGNKPDGQKTTQGQTMSEQLARMAAQQEAIRRQMQQYIDELKKNGEKPSNSLNELMNQMEKTETDLVNKIISQETLNRQKEILTRLLEHEKAEQKREQEERRESNEAKEQKYSNPNSFFQYNRLKANEQELLRNVQPAFNSYYKTKVNEYFYNFK